MLAVINDKEEDEHASGIREEKVFRKKHFFLLCTFCKLRASSCEFYFLYFSNYFYSYEVRALNNNDITNRLK